MIWKRLFFNSIGRKLIFIAFDIIANIYFLLDSKNRNRNVCIGIYIYIYIYKYIQNTNNKMYQTLEVFNKHCFPTAMEAK